MLTVKRPLGRDYNIRMDLNEIGINMRNRIGSAQDRAYWRALVNLELNISVPKFTDLIT